MYPQTNPYQPAPAWQPPRRWWQHPALIITLLVVFPPAGIALAWLGRWTTRTKIVASVLSGLWFLLILVSEPEQEKKTPGGDPKPVVTASATATPTQTPTVEPTTESPTPEPTTEAPTPTPTPTTEAPTPEPTTEPPTTRAPEPTTQAPTTRAPKPTPKPVQTTRPPETAEPEPEVYYANCTAVRAAGADPIRIGDPGYGSHLDRDGDGIACE
ncbi:excalibur calcium-binding domain-containing protein [Streptomyces sp. NRRL F-5727]|uniref:excalibur calcium-binding domain-containing protein n=1 Tax=Streptomyces sp. NRRL F-5727 TaxID=1463871 RepID=UPI00068EFD45|nr:excalibur calcium-binding domain-containing protein [Streptomyces sp. NRRL F-5727]